MIETGLVALHISSFNLFKTPHEVCTILYTFMMRKLKLTEEIEVVNSHMEKT